MKLGLATTKHVCKQVVKLGRWLLSGDRKIGEEIK
jgi:hypothetical protein